MKSFSPIGLPHLEPTAPEVFYNRRQVLAGMAVGTAAAGASIALPRQQPPAISEAQANKILSIPFAREKVFPAQRNEKYTLPEGVPSQVTDRLVAAQHNNFYEFLPGRGGPVWQFTDKYEVEPWKLEVTGLVNKPLTLDLDDIFSFPHEERLYHFRCVERWAMNVPWSGFPLASLIARAEPKAEAKFVRFVSAERPKQMPGLKQADYYPWPYHEALRLDEAMNELALVATGIYGEPLPRQHGAPVRIVVPWKYGYKNPKSIVKIELTAEQPPFFWQMQAHEYGFLSNINPNIPHPRWSQAESFWLETQEPFKTPLFNGYGAYLAGLYPDEPKTPQKALEPGQVAR